LRGRIAQPSGWISIFDLETGKRWAKRDKNEQQGIVVDKAADRASPSSVSTHEGDAAGSLCASEGSPIEAVASGVVSQPEKAANVDMLLDTKERVAPAAALDAAEDDFGEFCAATPEVEKQRVSHVAATDFDFSGFLSGTPIPAPHQPQQNRTAPARSCGSLPMPPRGISLFDPLSAKNGGLPDELMDLAALGLQ